MKQTPMPPRKAPLGRGSGLTPVPFPSQSELARTRTIPAVTGLRPKSAATKGTGSATGNLLAAPPSEFTPKVKRLVRRRAGRGDPFDALCEAGGEWLGADLGEFQHRDARGMGGSRDPVINGPAGCVLLCHDCHMLAESRDRDMLGMGFWLENGQDPRLEPVMLHGRGRGGLTLWLAEDGIGDSGTGYLYQRPEVLAA